MVHNDFKMFCEGDVRHAPIRLDAYSFKLIFECILSLKDAENVLNDEAIEAMFESKTGHKIRFKPEDTSPYKYDRWIVKPKNDIRGLNEFDRDMGAVIISPYMPWDACMTSLDEVCNFITRCGRTNRSTALHCYMKDPDGEVIEVHGIADHEYEKFPNEIIGYLKGYLASHQSRNGISVEEDIGPSLA